MIWILLALALWINPCTAAGDESIEKQLYSDLFSNYSSDLRPIKGGNYFQQIIVYVAFGLTQIEALVEKDQRLITHGYMALTWHDQLLQWDPADYNNAPFLIVPSTRVWLPEITAINSVSDADELAFEEDESRVRIISDGSISWIPSIRWSTSCSVDVSNFPYDEQECMIEFANWMYTSALVNFSAIPDIQMDLFALNSEWELQHTETFTEEIFDGHFSYPFLKLKLKIKRNPLYFELNVLLPAILLSFLLIPMFILPVESGEKVSLGITLMLSYSIFLLMLTDVTPRSGTTPKLTIAILVSIIFSGVGMFLNILIINVHHHLPNKEVPRVVRRLLFSRLACLLCGMKYGDTEVKAFQVQPIPIELLGEKSNKTLGKDFTSNDIAKLVEYLEYFKTKQLDDDYVEQNKEDWNKVARVLDRLCLVLYIIYFTVNVSVILYIKVTSQ